MGIRTGKHLAKTGLLVGVPVAFIGGFIILNGWVNRWVKDSRSGAPHTYRVQPVPPFLSEDLAVAKARQSLARDGYDLSVWKPSRDNRSHAPDGTPDVYLVRNTLNPNDGSIVFVDTSSRDQNPSRIVSVGLKGDQLECTVVTPK